MKKNKKVLAVLLTATISLAALTGCGNSSPVQTENDVESQKNSNIAENASQEEDIPNAESQEVTIDFWHHYNAQSAENETLMNVLIPKFEEENPGIKVNAVSHEWANLHEKLLISAQSDTLPDVARLDIAWVPEFQKMGILTALDEEMADYEDVAEGLLDSAMQTANIGGHSYGLALNTNSKMLFYNTQAFADAGISVPETMDEFIAAIRSLSGTNQNGQQVWGYKESALAGWNLCPFIWSMGGSLTNEDQTAASGYINSPETIDAIQTLADLYSEGSITGWNSGDFPTTEGFGTGRYLMIVEGPWKIAEMESAYPDFEYAITKFPAGKGGSTCVLGGEDISMFNDANKDAAWKFMKFMTSPFAQEEMVKSGQIPVNKEALESDTVKQADFAPFIDAITTAKSRPTTACWSEMDNALSVAVTSVMNGEKTAQEAMDELAVLYDKMLAE